MGGLVPTNLGFEENTVTKSKHHSLTEWQYHIGANKLLENSHSIFNTYRTVKLYQGNNFMHQYFHT